MTLESFIKTDIFEKLSTLAMSKDEESISLVRPLFRSLSLHEDEILLRDMIIYLDTHSFDIGYKNTINKVFYILWRASPIISITSYWKDSILRRYWNNMISYRTDIKTDK